MILNTKFSIKKTQFKSIRFIGCGSALLSKELQNQFQEKYGLYLSNMYGLSETGATHFDNPFVNERSTGNIGKPFDIYDIAIINNGKQCLPNTIGEIGIKGDGLFSGYLNENNNELYWDGYFLTGDIGQVDSSGLCHYIERKKDLIIRGGINILPSSIDSILLENKAVVESATVGAYDPVYGEKVISYIVCKEQVDIESMLNECKKQLGAFKAPSEIILIDRLPKGPSGKVLKRVLRDKVR
jgi:long-chain acyl-CoA synthetase